MKRLLLLLAIYSVPQSFATERLSVSVQSSCKQALAKLLEASSELPDIYRTHGYKSLRHETNIERIPSILRTGSMKPFKKLDPIEAAQIRDMGDPSKFYTFLTRFDRVSLNEPTEFSWFSSGAYWGPGNFTPESKIVARYTEMKMAQLFFDDRLLEAEVEYHISHNGQAFYGAYKPERDFKYRKGEPDNAARLAGFFSKEKPGEVVFYDSVSLKYLKSIWVFPEYRMPLIERLKAEGILTVNNRPIEELIRTVDINVRYEVLPNGHYRIFSNK